MLIRQLFGSFLDKLGVSEKPNGIVIAMDDFSANYVLKKAENFCNF